MGRFCFANVAKIIQMGLQPPNNNLDVCKLLLEWATRLPTVVTKEGESVAVDSRMTSKLFNNVTDVHEAIQEEVSNDKILSAAFQNAHHIIDQLNFITKDDMYEKLIELIDGDSSISQSKKRAFHSWFDQEDKAEFIAQVILYAIALPNKFSDITSEEEIQLLYECDNHCPVCGAPLVLCSDGGIPLPTYDVVRIFPKTKSLAAKLVDISQPDDLESLDNTILLCRRHAIEYEKTMSVETYHKMRSLKDEMIQKRLSNEQLQSINLEKELKDLISALANTNDDMTLVELSYDALRIREKIPDDVLLRRDVEMNVLKYCNFISDIFSRMDQMKTGISERIAGEIKFAYQKLKGTASKSEIVTRLARFVEEKAGVKGISDVTYRILIHYFIQHCEVFDAVSQ